jgi:apolipoprotein N-acyltransferase
MLSLILLVFAFVLFVVAGLAAPEPPWRSKLACFGLACWVLAELVRGIGPTGLH